MLGGYPQVSRIDLQQSSNFLAKLRRASKTHPATQGRLKRAVDCGAGIGRITLGFLSRVADKVDVVEPVEKFTREIETGEGFGEVRARGGLGRVWTVGLEKWDPTSSSSSDEEMMYDLVWVQWCLGQLTDVQVVAFLQRAKQVLTKGGWVCVKENLSNHFMGEDVYDETDSSVTRTDEKFRLLFEKAGCKVVSTELQRGFPKELYAVRIYALQPIG